MISLVGKLLDAMRRKAQPAVFYIASKALELVGDLGFGEVRPEPGQLKECAALLCASQGTSKACQVHHLIFSAPPAVPKKEAFPVLLDVARDWVNTYAPDRRWMAALQDHNGKPHLHLLVQNVGDDGRPLKIKPHQVKELAAMSFTSHALTAKGLGKARSMDVYPKAEKLSVRSLARDLAHVFNPREGLAFLVQRHPDLTDFRRRKDDSLISFKYGERRIRLSTLEGFLSDILGDLSPPAPVPLGPVLLPAEPPLPELDNPLDQFVEAAQRARPAQKPTPPGVNAPGINL